MSAENLLSLTPKSASDPTTIARELLASWKDCDYRQHFTRERVQSSVALQIRALREQRNQMTQTELGHRMGKAQPWISQIENPDYGKWSVSTLLDLADAFDTDLEIKFRPFSRSLYELSHQGEQYFEVRSFEEELPELEEVAESGWSYGSGKWTDVQRARTILYPPDTTSSLHTSVAKSFDSYQMASGSNVLATMCGMYGPIVVDRQEEREPSKGDQRHRRVKGGLKREAA